MDVDLARSIKSTDPYFMLFRGLLRVLAAKGIFDENDATAIVSEALAYAADSGDSDSADRLDELEKLMYDSLPKTRVDERANVHEAPNGEQ